MNLLDGIYEVIAPVKALKRKQARLVLDRLGELQKVQAGYDGAGSGRRWITGASTSQNSENLRGLKALRYASRELERNNPYVGNAADVIESYAVGTGIVPKARGGTKKKRELADALMKEWMHNTDIDFNGSLDLFGIQSLAVRTVTISGEAIVLPRFAKDRALAVPLRLQLLEGDYIDDSKNSGLVNGVGDVQGVSFSGSRKRGYWLTDSHPGEGGRLLNSSFNDAAYVAHAYKVLRPGQVRGIPSGYSVFTRMKGLDDAYDAFIELFRMAACFGMIVTSEETAAPDKSSPAGILPEEMSPGMALALRPGDSVNFATPPSISGQEGFHKSQERLIATAYGISYSALTGDYSEGNFAAEKMAAVRMYMNIARLRRRVIVPMHLKRIEAWWLQAAGIAGHDLRGIEFEWTPPRKEILDLKNELPAIVEKIRAGLGSLQGELREWGTSIEVVMEEIKEDYDLMEKLGVVLSTNVAQTNKSGQLQSAPADKNEDEAAQKDEEV